MTAADASTGPTGRVVVFGPSPLLEVSVEPGPGGGPSVRVLAGGQPVWVARMAHTFGSAVTLCGLSGGDVGAALEPLLAREPFACRLVATHAEAGCFVVDQRHEPALDVASDWAQPPSAAEVEQLVAATVESTQATDVLVVCNPMPGDALGLDTYPALVAAATASGARVVVDLSTPRLDAALRGGPAVVKINDWELAEVVTAPVDSDAERAAAMHRVLEMGAAAVVVTRGGSTAYALEAPGAPVALTPPVLRPGRAAGCGDAMTGALAAALAQGTDWLRAVSLAMAAGAAHYRGRGESSRSAIEMLASQVTRGDGPR